jgi:hypothetical protein
MELVSAWVRSSSGMLAKYRKGRPYPKESCDKEGVVCKDPGKLYNPVVKEVSEMIQIDIQGETNTNRAKNTCSESSTLPLIQLGYSPLIIISCRLSVQTSSQFSPTRPTVLLWELVRQEIGLCSH